MCVDPVTAGLMISGVGLLQGLQGQRLQGQANRAKQEALIAQQGAQQEREEAISAQEEFKAKVARENAEIARKQASDVIARGGRAARRHRLLVKGAVGGARTSFAARGVGVESGSAASVTNDIIRAGGIDEATIAANAEREALGFRTQARNFERDAELALMRAETPSTVAGTDAVLRATSLAGAANQAAGLSSLLGGAGRLFARFGEYLPALAFDEATDRFGSPVAGRARFSV